MGIKASSGYCGKISRFLDPKKKRFSGMKSHDCHVMMMQILPVAFIGIMEKHICDTLTGLCNFLDVISKVHKCEAASKSTGRDPCHTM